MVRMHSAKLFMVCERVAFGWESNRQNPCGLAEAVGERPRRAFFGRLFDFDDQIIRAGALGGDAGCSLVGFLPGFRLRELAVGIVDMDRDFGRGDVGAEPEPVFVSLEELRDDGLGTFHGQLAAPVILPESESLLYVWVGCF